MNLIMLCYNIKRSINILGITEILKNLQTWTPNYTKAFWLRKTVHSKRSLSQNTNFHKNNHLIAA